MKFNATNLPSRMIPYQVKEINIKKMNPRQLALFSESVVLESMEPVVRAVNQLIDFDAGQLTYGDFYYILTFLRFKQRNIPYMVEWTCDGILYERDDGRKYTEADIAQMVEAYENAEDKSVIENPAAIMLRVVACGAHNTEPVEFEDFKIHAMPEHKLDPRLDYPRASTLDSFVKALGDPSSKWLATAASWLRDGETIDDKINRVFQNEDMETFDLATVAARDLTHGVLQSVAKECPRCGQVHYAKISVDAASFFA